MTAADVAETLRLALNAAGLDRATVQQGPRLLSDNGPSYLSAQLGHELHARQALSSDDPPIEGFDQFHECVVRIRFVIGALYRRFGNEITAGAFSLYY